jgi:acetyltransferase-like isoleucine patch superfamily enzyme
MKAYILPSGRKISPFGDPVSESMIGNRTLADHQDLVLRRAGFEAERIAGPGEIDESRFLLTYDDVFFTRRVMDDFAKQAAKADASIRCGLPADSLFVNRTRALQDLPEGDGLALYRLAWIHAEKPPRTGEELAACLQAARPVRARFKEKVLQMPAPPRISGFSHYDHPVTSSVVMHIRHWVHLLWANQLSVQIRWVETVLDHKPWAFWKLVQGGAIALFSGRWSRAGILWTLLGRANRRGKNCFVHPTARVEGCLFGDNVKVGAYALVRGSVLGDNVTIEDRANVYFSVVGSDCFISKNSTMVFCAGYPGSDLCTNGIQACLFGRGCALTSFVRVIDIKARGEIRVMFEGQLHSAGTNLLGACFGHRSFAGLDVAIQPGREIPNGAVLVKPPGDIFHRIPADLPPGVPAWVEDGVAVTGKKKG